jgi:hypothetical protein
LAKAFTATVPTVGDALAALDDVCSDLAEVLRQISDISAELANKDRISMTDVQEVGVVHIQLRRSTDAPLQILRDYDSTILQELELDQTRSLVYRELKKIGQSRKEAAKVALGKEPSDNSCLCSPSQYSYMLRFDGNATPAHLETPTILLRAEEHEHASCKIVDRERNETACHDRSEYFQNGGWNEVEASSE